MLQTVWLRISQHTISSLLRDPKMKSKTPIPTALKDIPNCKGLADSISLVSLLNADVHKINRLEETTCFPQVPPSYWSQIRLAQRKPFNATHAWPPITYPTLCSRLALRRHCYFRGRRQRTLFRCHPFGISPNRISRCNPEFPLPLVAQQRFVGDRKGSLAEMGV